jgi:hypothetical protein
MKYSANKSESGSHFSRMVALLSLCCLSINAGIPEPDNVLYGTITIGGIPITASRTDIIIEARRSVGGPALSRYRMGSDPRLGNFYSLNVPLESVPPIIDASSSQVGDALIIVLTDATGMRAQTTYNVAERGHVLRVDFGAVPAGADSDGDGLPDAWELNYFGNLNQGAGSTAPNGLTVLETFVQGISPTDTDLFELQITMNAGQQTVTFYGRRAEGAGYEGRSRLYSLEFSGTLAPGSWQAVPNFTDRAGANETFIYQTTATVAPLFYRARARLEGP